MSSENNSSPWNVAPASSPESPSPWAVSPFQTSNPFKSPVKSSSPAETEPEPDTASYAVGKGVPSTEESTPIFAAAFEPVKKAEKAEKPAASSSPWTVPPVAENEETLPSSVWTSAVPVAVEEVKETPYALAENIRAPAVEESVEEVKESIVKKDEREVWEQTDDDDTTGAETLQEASASAWTTSPVQAKAESKSVAAEFGAEEINVAEEAEVSDDSLGDSPVAVKSIVDAPAPMIDEFVVLHNEAADEGTSVATSDGSWATESVQEEVLSVTTDVGTVLKGPVDSTGLEGFVTHADLADAVVDEVTVEDAAVVEDAGVEGAAVMDAAVDDTAVEDTAVVKADEESCCIEKSSSEAASAWTVAPVQKETSEANSCTAAHAREEDMPAKIATLVSVVKSPEPVAETPEAIAETPEPLVATASKPMVEVHVTEDGPLTSAWNAALLREEVLIKDVPVALGLSEQKFAATVENVKVRTKEVVVKAEKDSRASSSAWNATPPREEIKAATVEKSIKPVKKAESVQKRAIADDRTKNATKETPVAAVKEVVVATEAVVEDGKIDKKAIANAFDGVASYEVNSVAKSKKVPSVEAAVTRPADAPGTCGACGMGGCSIQ